MVVPAITALSDGECGAGNPGLGLEEYELVNTIASAAAGDGEEAIRAEYPRIVLPPCDAEVGVNCACNFILDGNGAVFAFNDNAAISGLFNEFALISSHALYTRCHGQMQQNKIF